MTSKKLDELWTKLLFNLKEASEAAEGSNLKFFYENRASMNAYDIDEELKRLAQLRAKQLAKQILGYKEKVASDQAELSGILYGFNADGWDYTFGIRESIDNKDMMKEALHIEVR